MTREDEIINAAYNEAEVERQLKMHPQVFEQGFVAGAKWADRTMIEKACEWLLLNNNLHGINVRAYINNFRKAMKGE